MGASQRGGGQARQNSTDKVARAAIAHTPKPGRELSQRSVQRLTEGLCMVELFVHGGPGAGRYIYAEDQLKEEQAGVLPPPGERKGSHSA